MIKQLICQLRVGVATSILFASLLEFGVIVFYATNSVHALEEELSAVDSVLDDIGVSIAPLNQVDKRVIIVAKDGSGDYKKIQAALANSQPGDTIRVKNGTYNEAITFRVSGTESEPIALVNYPGHNPVIRLSGGKSVQDFSPGESVTIMADWIIVEGMEITNGYHGIVIKGEHITISNCYVHHMGQSGLLANNSAGDLLIEDSEFSNNGLVSFVAWNGGGGDDSHPRLYHGIYISKNQSCIPVERITIRHNVFSENSGFGIKMSDHGCGSPGGPRDSLVEDNLFLNNANGIVLDETSAKGNNITVRNNTFVFETVPINYPARGMLAIWKGQQGNTIVGNTFYSTRTDIRAIWSKDKVNSNDHVDHNVWKVNGGKWMWLGNEQKDFTKEYQPLTGWDLNGQLNSAK